MQERNFKLKLIDLRKKMHNVFFLILEFKLFESLNI